jgi:hypothetical protein
LGYILALPIIVPIVAASTGTLHSYSLVVTMTSTRDGHLQVFYDDGGGYSEQRSATVSLLPTHQSHEYRLALPAGRYRRLRMDPGTVGGVAWPRYDAQRRSLGLDGLGIAVIDDYRKDACEFWAQFVPL